jgi:hypothetical protein
MYSILFTEAEKNIIQRTQFAETLRNKIYEAEKNNNKNNFKYSMEYNNMVEEFGIATKAVLDAYDYLDKLKEHQFYNSRQDISKLYIMLSNAEDAVNAMTDKSSSIKAMNYVKNVIDTISKLKNDGINTFYADTHINKISEKLLYNTKKIVKKVDDEDIIITENIYNMIKKTDEAIDLATNEESIDAINNMCAKIMKAIDDAKTKNIYIDDVLNNFNTMLYKLNNNLKLQ